MKSPSSSSAIILCLALCHCGGGDSSPIVRVAPADSYLVTGVVKVLPDGLTANAQRSFRFKFTELSEAGGQVRGKLIDLNGNPIEVQGSYDEQEQRVVFENISGAFTSTLSETTVGLGFRIDDGTPKDGIGSELSGYIRTSTGSQSTQGLFVGIQDSADALSMPDKTKLQLEVTSLGRVRLTSEEYAFGQATALQYMRFSLRLDTPTVETLPVPFDGVVDFERAGLEGDVFLVRAFAVGRLSDAAILFPQP